MILVNGWMLIEISFYSDKKRVLSLYMILIVNTTYYHEQLKINV